MDRCNRSYILNKTTVFLPKIYAGVFFHNAVDRPLFWYWLSKLYVIALYFAYLTLRSWFTYFFYPELEEDIEKGFLSVADPEQRCAVYTRDFKGLKSNLDPDYDSAKL